MAKPKVILNCVADKYSGPEERIIEFSSKSGGGLISFWETTLPDGSAQLRVDLYHLDKKVKVVVAKGSLR